jgi:hypothetical protein
MGEKEEEIKINDITRDFIQRLSELSQKGISTSEIIKKLEWNKTSFSLVRAKKRDVPVETWQKLYAVFKLENKFLKKNEDTISVNVDPSQQAKELVRLRAVTDILLKYVLEMRASYYGRPLKDDVQKTGVVDEYERDLVLQLQQLRNGQL